jgi:hypothetical protein
VCLGEVGIGRSAATNAGTPAGSVEPPASSITTTIPVTVANPRLSLRYDRIGKTGFVDASARIEARGEDELHGQEVT